MAEYLASIFGTEKDKHGERCSRLHNKPSFSQTILLQNLFLNPQNVTQPDGTIVQRKNMSEEEAQEYFDNFFEDIFVELEDKYGEIEEMNVCDNLGDHLVGNVYVKFKSEEDAEKAIQDLNNRWFAGKPIYAELSPVTDFREACCRQYEMGECTRSGFCNFMHLKPISRELRRELYGRKRGYRSRSRSRERRRSRSRERRSHSRDRKKRRRSSSREKKSSKHSRSRDRSSRSRSRRSKSRDRVSKSRERRSSSKDRHSRSEARVKSEDSAKKMVDEQQMMPIFQLIKEEREQFDGQAFINPSNAANVIDQNGTLAQYQ